MSEQLCCGCCWRAGQDESGRFHGKGWSRAGRVMNKAKVFPKYSQNIFRVFRTKSEWIGGLINPWK